MKNRLVKITCLVLLTSSVLLFIISCSTLKSDSISSGDEAQTHYNLAQMYYKKGLYQEAMTHYAAALAINPLLTDARTGWDAANKLSSIFQKDTQTIESGELVGPKQQLSLKEIDSSTDAKAGDKKSDAKNSEADTKQDKISDSSDSRPEVLMKVDKKSMAKDSRVSNKTAGAPTLASALPISYWIQIGSYHSKETASLVANSLKGYSSTVRPWKSAEGEEWYRLVVGPFLNKEKALNSKADIERKHQFKTIILSGTDSVIKPKRSRIQSQGARVN